MLSPQVVAALLSVLRSLLIAGGTYLAAKGYFGAGQVEQVVGVLMTVVTAAIGARVNFKNKED